ncbi:MAG: 30S ribosomal protein S30e [Thermoprotei archaeon]|nr:MAG: 30S ribosomal protein S30e [Thermoprotei archaeon]RLF14934.1 MAG: 30S ribosomal protein S30e [Thermoprotei archaeon]
MPSHGSLTKAGKVRSQTPKIPPRPRTRPSPRVGFRKRYFRRIVYPALASQASA